MEQSSSVPCHFVAWEDYNWNDLIQCNHNGSGIKLHWNPAVFCIIAATHAITIYSCLQLIFRACMTFKRWRTVYFWSLLCTLIGVVLVTISIELRLFVLKADSGFLAAMYSIGWFLLKTGFGFVLYSRLHLVVTPAHRLVLRAVLISLIITALGSHVPETVAVAILCARPTEKNEQFQIITGYIAIVYTVQVYILLGLYIYYFRKSCGDIPSNAPVEAQKYIHNTYYWLIGSGVLTFATKTVLMVLQFRGMVLARFTWMNLVYMAVLAQELLVLERLLKVSTVRVELMQQGNMNVSFLDKEVALVAARDFHKQQIRSLRLPVRIALLPVQAVSGERSAPSRARRDELEDLERRYLGPS